MMRMNEEENEHDALIGEEEEKEGGEEEVNMTWPKRDPNSKRDSTVVSMEAKEESFNATSSINGNSELENIHQMIRLVERQVNHLRSLTKIIIASSLVTVAAALVWAGSEVRAHMLAPGLNLVDGKDVKLGNNILSGDKLLQNYSTIIPPHVAPKHIYLLGERNSGTSYVESILRSAFYPQYGNTEESDYPFAKGLPVFHFKHMFRHNEMNNSEIEELRKDGNNNLWILVVRSPCDWADGMYRKPWHMCPPNKTAQCGGVYIPINKAALEGIDRASFFRLNWRDNPEANNGQNFTYSNVFSLRSHKLKIMQQLINVVPHRVVIAHLKRIEDDPERFIQDISTQFKLDVPSNREKVQASTKMHSTLCLTDEEWLIAQREIDWNIEGRFGFNPLDCHVCVQR